jgi:hypothetical protein
MQNPATRDADRVTRTWHVRDRDGELTGAACESVRGTADVLDPTECVEGVVELVGVVETLALTGFGPDEVEPRQGGPTRRGAGRPGSGPARRRVVPSDR